MFLHQETFALAWSVSRNWNRWFSPATHRQQANTNNFKYDWLLSQVLFQLTSLIGYRMTRMTTATIYWTLIVYVPHTVLSSLHTAPSLILSTTLGGMFQKKNETQMLKIVCSAEIKQFQNTYFSPLHSRVRGAIPRELVCTGTGQKGHELLGSSRFIIFPTRNHVWGWRQGGHSYPLDTWAGIWWSPLKSTILFKVQDHTGASRYYLHFTEKKMTLRKLYDLSRVLQLRSGFCYVKK